MKMITAISTLLMSLASFATETRTFFFDGTQENVMMSLRSEETHTEYRYETRWTTCYRQEVYYQTICSGSPVPSCVTRPIYRTVAYPCQQTFQIPYQVKDYDVEANVALSVLKGSALAAGETFKVTLDGNKLTLSGKSSKRNFILVKKEAVRTTVTGSVKMIDAAYTAELVDAAPVVSALSLTNIGLKDSTLSFKMGPVAARDLIGFHLNVKKSPILGTDTVLFDRELASSEIQLNAQDNASVADINIDKLGVELTSGRYTLTAKAFFKFAGRLLNGGDFEAVESSRTLIYKIR